jgi:MarR family transcriptional regulator, organic hydroperoxide resistance regulator
MRSTRRKATRPPRPSDPRALARAARTPPPAPPTPPNDLGSRFDGAGQSPGFVLWQVATLWQREIRGALEPLGLTHAQFVLLASTGWLVAHAGGTPVMQADIADHARLDAVMTSEVLRTLEHKKLVRRLPHPLDGRARHIVLTAAGQRLVRTAIERVEDTDAAFFTRGTPELTTLVALLRGTASP